MKSADFHPQNPSEIVHRGEGMSVLVIYGFWHLESVPQTGSMQQARAVLVKIFKTTKTCKRIVDIYFNFDINIYTFTNWSQKYM